jgi:integrase
MGQTKRRTRTPGTFGAVEKLPSGRYRARYRGPDGARHTGPTVFRTIAEAKSWLALQQTEITRDAWLPPAAKTTALTFADYAEGWLAQRELKDRTRQHYRKLLDQHLIPAFGTTALRGITADQIRAWHAGIGKTTPTLRAHCYGLLRTILGTAVADAKLAANPCAIKGAGSTRRVHAIRPASLPELAKLTQAMPDQYAAMILLAAWCALRFGELTELRRQDLDLDPDAGIGVIRVQRAVVRTEDGFQITTPKSDAGVRDVAIPPHLVPLLAEHLAKHVEAEEDSLLFPAHHGEHLAPSTLYRHFYAARKAAGRPDLRFHDLRHSGAVLAALSGATLPELMGRLGHATPAAAMRYQHVAAGRDQQIAAALSKLAQGQP